MALYSSLPCTSFSCITPGHDIAFHTCSDTELVRLLFHSVFDVIHSQTVNYSCLDDEFIFLQTPDSPQLECDLLHNADIRNSANCVFADMPDKINVASHGTLPLHLNIRSIPAHWNEFEVIFNLLVKPSCTVIGISETWLNNFNESWYALSGYQSVLVSRQEGSGGEGVVAIFCTPCIRIQEVWWPILLLHR